MKNIILIIFVNLASLSFAAAQTPLSIRGQISDEAGRAVEAVNLQLLDGRDSVVRRSVTDLEGKFNLQNVKSGTYRLRFSSIGFAEYTTALLELSEQKPVLELATIVLKAGSSSLSEVVVVGEKEFVEQKIDRTVLNVDALITNTGTNALELLEKAPGVSVDQNGSISLKGKSGVMVLIDDRPTYLSGQELAAYLRSLPSGTISQVELITNPPAKYDAAGNAGIINIKTKKSRINGINGSFSATLTKGVYWRNNENINLSYRVNKFNLFTNASLNMQDTWRHLALERRYFTNAGNLNSVFASDSYFYPKHRTPNIKLGADYYLTDKTTLGFVLSGSDNHRRESRPGESVLTNGAGLTDSTITATNTEENTFKNRSVNVNFNHQFDSANRSLSFDLDYVKYSAAADQSFLNEIFYADSSPSSAETLVADLPSDIRIYSAKADYNHPLRAKANLSAGLKSSYVNTDNAANYFNLINGIPAVDYDKTNRFKYKENIQSAYLNFNKEFRRLTLQTGLRFESTTSTGHQLGNAMKADSAFRKTYTNLFPTAYLSYKLDSAGKNQLNLSAGRRIGRPYYQDLNPFVFLLDKFSYFGGNPLLRPEFANNFELSYNYNNRLTFAVLYNYATDVFNEVIRQRGNAMVSSTGNIGKRVNAGISVNATLRRGNWWTMNFYGQLMRNRFEGTIGDIALNTGSTVFNGRINQQFTFPKGWSAELSGFYNTREAEGQFVIMPLGSVDAGLQKKILDNKGSIKVAARDIFHTLEPRGMINNLQNARGTFHNFLDSRVVSATFSYSFSKGASAKANRRTGGAGSEVDRVKN